MGAGGKQVAYEATRTGAYQTAIKAADAFVAAFADRLSPDSAQGIHEKVRRAVYEDIRPVVEQDITDAKSRPQSSGGGGRRSGGGGGQSTIPTDGSTMFGKKDANGQSLDHQIVFGAHYDTWYVGSADNGYFSWDGKTLTPLTTGKPDKPQVIQGQGGAIYRLDVGVGELKPFTRPW